MDAQKGFPLLKHQNDFQNPCFSDFQNSMDAWMFGLLGGYITVQHCLSGSLTE